MTNWGKCNAGRKCSGMRKNILWLFDIILVCCTLVFISCRPHKDILPTVQRIQERGELLVGTTGDYRPLTFREADSTYWGFEIDMAEEMARRLGVGLRFVPTSWPTLTDDVLAAPQAFDLAASGITITEERLAMMAMSEGYLENGKTILCRVEDSAGFRSLEDIDRPEVRVMVNPGGQNEKSYKLHAVQLL